LHGSRLRGATVIRLETSGYGGDETGERGCVMSFGNGVDPAATLKSVKSYVDQTVYMRVTCPGIQTPVCGL
jgi:hypothetical protein